MGQGHSEIKKSRCKRESKERLLKEDEVDSYNKPSAASNTKANQVEEKTSQNSGVLMEGKEDITERLNEMAACLLDISKVVHSMVDQTSTSNGTPETCTDSDSSQAYTLADKDTTFKESGSAFPQDARESSTPNLHSGASDSQPNVSLSPTLMPTAVQISNSSRCYKSNKSIKLHFYRNESNEYSLITPTAYGGQVYMHCTPTKSVLCLMKENSKQPNYHISISGVAGIAQGYDYIFVLQQSEYNTCCIRYNMQLSDERILFTDSRMNILATSLCVNDKYQLTLLRYDKGEQSIAIYDFNGYRVQLIEPPDQLRGLQTVVPLGIDSFVLYSRQYRELTCGKLCGAQLIGQWKVNGYKFHCVTVDENECVYGVTQVGSTGFSNQMSLCVISMDKEGNTLAVLPIPQLEFLTSVTVSRIQVRLNYMTLQCGSHGTYRFQIA